MVQVRCEKEVIMKIVIVIGIILLIIVFSISSNREASREVSMKVPAVRNVNPINDDCVNFVSLIPADEVAKEIGKSEFWVLGNYPINLWEKPSSVGNRGRIVGEMISGSNAKLVEKKGNDYFVISQKDKSRGWVSGVQVKRIVKLNQKTFKRCD